MATRETTIEDWHQPSLEQEREQVLDEGAKYGRQTVREYEPEHETRVCRNCGADIDAEIARVCGDDHDNVPCCKHCAHQVLPRGRKAYTNTVKVVYKYLGEEGL